MKPVSQPVSLVKWLPSCHAYSLSTTQSTNHRSWHHHYTHLLPIVTHTWTSFPPWLLSLHISLSESQSSGSIGFWLRLVCGFGLVLTAWLLWNSLSVPWLPAYMLHLILVVGTHRDEGLYFHPALTDLIQQINKHLDELNLVRWMDRIVYATVCYSLPCTVYLNTVFSTKLIVISTTVHCIIL